MKSSRLVVKRRLSVRYVTAFEDACEELRMGPFCILSEKALDRLVTLFSRIAGDSYRAGEEEGKRQIKKEKKRK